MENSILVPMSYEEMMEIDGGGFWKNFGKILLAAVTVVAALVVAPLVAPFEPLVAIGGNVALGLIASL